MEIGTIIGDNGYIDYTASSSKFLDYLSPNREAVNSFEVITKYE